MGAPQASQDLIQLSHPLAPSFPHSFSFSELVPSHHWSSAYLNLSGPLLSLSLAQLPPTLSGFHFITSPFLVFPEKEHFTGRNHALD